MSTGERLRLVAKIIPLLLVLVIAVGASDCNKLEKAADEIEQGAGQIATLDDVELTDVKEKQDLKHNGQLWSGLSIIMEGEQYDLGQRIPEDCYFEAVSAAAVVSRFKLSRIAFGELAKGMASAYAGGIDTGNYIGDAMIRVGAYVITAVGLTDTTVTDAVVESVTKEVAGYILGRASNDFVGRLAGDELTQKGLEQLLKSDDVVVAIDEGRSPSSGTRVKIAMFYNPYTHYVVASVGADCSTSRYLFRYEVDGDGIPVDRTDVWVKAVTVD